MQDWFKTWFDSPYYHILYRERDEKEARQVIHALIDFLKPEPGSVMLDQACGRGRHARILASLGFEVTGIDLSENNIVYCKQFEAENLHFAIHDIRRIISVNTFDYVFNLFTSIGYFRHDHDQQLTVSSAAAALKKGGFFIIDFMNVHWVISRLIPEEHQTIDGIHFHISRRVENGFIIKEIKFRADHQDHHFTESVEAMTIEDFDRYFEQAGLKRLHIFGNYSLQPFDKNLSERLILIAQKL
jgi:SAM-dependent methyltransferase